MLYRAEITALLEPLVGGRVYAEHFPQQPLPQWPAIRVSRSGGAVEQSNCGSGPEETDNADFDIDIVALAVDEVEALGSQVRTALEAMTTPAVLNNPPIIRPDFDTRTHISTLQYTIYGSSLT